MYVVLPEHVWWDERGPQVTGAPVPDGFVYSSDGNEWWLTSEELSGLLRFGSKAAA